MNSQIRKTNITIVYNCGIGFLQANNYCDVVSGLLCFAKIYVQLWWLMDTNDIDMFVYSMYLYVCSLNWPLLVVLDDTLYKMLVNRLTTFCCWCTPRCWTVQSSFNLVRSAFQSFHVVHAPVFPAKSVSQCLLSKPQCLIVKSKLLPVQSTWINNVCR